ncbi:unnamed protein product [Dovyalis caffra]|uniref:Protein BIC1 n=1 Tax=Dovyalis caffra TaxID=77055 RepID=A0AAV1R8H6_9ROSI|nr:unnamed protein product [Dovyalis caffra]
MELGAQYFSSKKEEEPTINLVSLGSTSQNITTSSSDQATSSSVSPKEVVHRHGNAKEAEDHQVLVHRDCGRERLKRHREEVAGRVMVPDTWDQENLLKDWTDCSTFDELLAPKGVSSARAALVAEGRRESSSRLRIAMWTRGPSTRVLVISSNSIQDVSDRIGYLSSM